MTNMSFYNGKTIVFDRNKLGLFLVVFFPFTGITNGKINAVLLMVGFLCIIHKNTKIMPKSFIVWATSFTVMCLASYLWASNKTTILSTTLSFIQVVIIVVSLYFGCNDNNVLIYILNCMVFGSLVYSAYIFATIPFSRLMYSGRVGGGNSVAIRLTMLSVLMFIYRTKYKHKFYVYGLIALFVFMAFLQGSRKGFIILAIGFFLVMIFEANEKCDILMLLRNVIIVIGIVVGIYYLIMYTPLYNSIGIRVEKTINYMNTGVAVDGSTRDRSLFASEGIRIWKEDPILGIGQDNFRYRNSIIYGWYSHNNFVEILCNLGIVGFIIYYSFWGSLLKKIIKYFLKTKQKSLIAPLVIMILTLLLDYFHVSYSSETTYLFLGFALVAIGIFESNIFQINNNQIEASKNKSLKQ